ncbi:MAG: L,D-transpeptidase [Bacteroidetes bacterium]|nr:L,D-transpeptidase [Bacteroidota bacterium]
MKKTIAFFALLILCTQMEAQRRQADSLRLKQIQYNNKVLEDAKAKRAADAKKNNDKAFVVVSYDSRGNKVETYKTNNGEKITTTTIKMPAAFNKPFDPDTIDKDSITLKVIKAKYRLQVYYKGKLLTMYKSVFGPNHLLQKQQEGDRRTPEGTFTILDIKKHDKWDLFMLLDYPNKESYCNFEICKSNREIPESARIGGSVGIHGIWPKGDNVIDLKHNWTDGCVALKNKDIEELSKIIKPGYTKITIVRN